MFGNLGGAMKNITAKAEELVEEKKNAAASLLEKQSGGGLHAGLDLGSLLGDTVRNITSHANTPAAQTRPAEPATPTAGPVGQIASEAKTLVDKTAAQLKPALDHVVQDTINPVAQGLAQKLQPIAGDVSAHVNTALAEGVKQLNPIVDDVTSKAKDFVDDAAKQVSSVVDEKLKEADDLVSEKREALGEPAKSMLSKAKGLFG